MGPIDQATCAGDGVLDQDQTSLALVHDLRVLLVDVIQALEDDPAPPKVVAVLTAADANLRLPER